MRIRPAFAKSAFVALAVLLACQVSMAKTQPPAQTLLDGYKVNSATMAALDQKLTDVAHAFREVCTAGRKITQAKPDDPQYQQLEAALNQIGPVSPFSLTVQDTSTRKPQTIKFDSLCDGQSKKDVPFERSSHEQIITTDSAFALGNALSTLGEDLRQIANTVNQNDDLAKAAQSGAPGTFAGDVDSAWTALDGLKTDLRVAAPNLSFDIGASARISSPAPKQDSTPSQVSQATETSQASQSSTQPAAHGMPAVNLSLLPVGLNLVLLVLLIVILLKVNSRDSQDLSRSSAELVAAVNANVAQLNKKMRELGELTKAVQGLQQTIQSTSGNAGNRGADSDAIYRRVLEAIQSAQIAGAPASQKKSSPLYTNEDPYPPVSPEPYPQSRSSYGSGSTYSPSDQQSSATWGNDFATAAGSAAQTSERYSGDVVQDYNRARSMEGGDSWFRKNYTVTPLSCVNIEFASSGRSADLRFVEDKKGNFFSVWDGQETKAFPSFRIDFGPFRKELEGVFVYRADSGSLHVARAAKLKPSGNQWALFAQGEIQNG